VTRATTLTEVESRTICRCINDSLLAYRLKNSKGHKQCTALYVGLRVWVSGFICGLHIICV
jgi:hypothetical protein